MNYNKFLLFGDSITEFAYNSRLYPDTMPTDGFTVGGGLTNAYVRKMDVIPRGFVGYTSSMGVKILPEILKNEQKIVIGTIGFGSNDCSLGGPVHVHIDEYVDNIKKMINIYKQNGVDNIVLISPAVIDEAHWETLQPDEVKLGVKRTKETYIKYTLALETVAKLEKVGFVNMNKVFTDYINKNNVKDWENELLVDGIHFSSKASHIYLDALLEAIHKYYPQCHPDNIEYKLPFYLDVKQDLSNLC